MSEGILVTIEVLIVRKFPCYISRGSIKIIYGQDRFKDWSDHEYRASYHHDYVFRGARVVLTSKFSRHRTYINSSFQKCQNIG